jgi:hypothetical protein
MKRTALEPRQGRAYIRPAMPDATTIRQIELQLYKAERGLGMPYDAERVAQLRFDTACTSLSTEVRVAIGASCALLLRTREVHRRGPDVEIVRFFKREPGRTYLQKRRLRNILQVAEDLKRLLEEDAQSGLGLSRYPFTGSDPLTVLKQLTNYVDRVLEPLDGDGETRPVPLKGSALDWAVSSMMDTYTRYFQRKAAFSRTGGEVAGPFIRFAYAALRELKIFNDGKPYSRNTIARAVTALKPR